MGKSKPRDPLYPALTPKEPLTHNMADTLRRGNIHDIETLQACSEEDLLYLRNVNENVISVIHRFLASQGLRLRYNDESRSKRLLSVFKDAYHVPLYYLCNVWTPLSPYQQQHILSSFQEKELRKRNYVYYGDLTRATRAELAGLVYRDALRSTMEPLLSELTIDAIQRELEALNLSFAPE